MQRVNYDYYERNGRQPSQPYARQIRNAYTEQPYANGPKAKRKVKEDLILKSFGLLDFVWGMIVLFGIIAFFILSAGAVELGGGEIFGCILGMISSALSICAGLIAYRSRSRRRNAGRMTFSFFAAVIALIGFIVFAAQGNSKFIYCLLELVFSLFIYFESRKLIQGAVRRY